MRALFALFLVISLSASLPITVVFGQTANTTTTTERAPGDTMIPPSTTVTRFIDDTGLTISYVPPGWSVIDHDNTSPEAVARQDEIADPAVTLCPPYSQVDTSSAQISLLYSYTCTEPNEGEVQIWYYPAMDKHDYFVPRATVVNPNTGLLELNLTGQDIVDYTTSPRYDRIVQEKTVPVNTTHSENGTTWQVPGLLVLFTDPIELKLSYIGLYFVDHTAGYRIVVSGPQRGEDTEEPDPRGEAVPIHGIGLDNLPPVMAEPLKIINSVSITRR